LVTTTLEEIQLEELWEAGMRGILLDLDNTIAPWNNDEVTAQASNFIVKAKEKQFMICLFSNARVVRAKRVAEVLQIPYYAPAYKPFKKAYKQALNIMKLSPEKVMVIGDQLFTDVLGGNRAGCFTILVTPLNKNEFSGTKIIRFLERAICKRKIN
jgi:hypothetical protein